MKWQNRRYLIQPILCPVADLYSNPFYPTISTANRSFRVPDDDNDSSSDISRADSLAIVDSYPRTFSVPSSDDEAEDDECIALEDDMPGKELGKGPIKASINRVTISVSNTGIRSGASAGVKASDKHVGVGIHESMGASQRNPIDLDRGHEHAIDIDSDDDGPEVLPIDHSITVAGNKFVAPHEEPLRTASKDLWSPACQNADADSNASQYGDDEDFFRDLEKIQVRDTQAQTFEPRPMGPQVSFDLPSPDSMTDTRDPFDSENTQRSSHHIDYLGSIDISRTGSNEGLDSTQRPSSPSDAALAKKSVAPIDSDNNLSYCEGLQQLQQEGRRRALEARLLEKPQDQSINEKVDQLNFTRDQHAGAQIERQDKSESANGPTHLRHGDTAMIGPYQCKPHTNVPELAALPGADIYPLPARRNPVVNYSDDLGARNESLKSYNTGPFSTLSDYTSFKPGFSDFYAGPKYDNLYTHPDPYHTGYCGTAWNDPNWGSTTYKAASGAGDNWKRPHNIATTLEPYLAGPPPPPKIPLPDQFRSPYENPPRVTISDLVNSAAPASHGQKRKADDMNKEETLRAPTEAASPLIHDGSQGSVILPDAQPRDQPTMPETNLSQETSNIQDTYEPAIHNASATLARDDGPARKKAKTSPSKTAGIGKFVSGIAVGIVGVLATFIATIPASVREEALREINNVA